MKIKQIGAGCAAMLSLCGVSVSSDLSGVNSESPSHYLVDSMAEYVYLRVQAEGLQIQQKRQPTVEDIKAGFEMERQRLSLLYADVLSENQGKDMMITELKKEIGKLLDLGKVTQRYYFATAEKELGGVQLEEAKAILSSVASMDDVQITISGRADPRGNAEFNKKLAQSRIDFVYDLAVSLGVDEGSIKTLNYGEVGEWQENAENYFFQRYLSIDIRKVLKE